MRRESAVTVILVVLTIMWAVVAYFLLAPELASAGGWRALPTPASVADDYWPDSRCHGHSTVRPVDQAFIRYVTQVRGAVGTVDAETCTVFVARHMLRDPAAYCAVLAHEFGHLAGLDHSPDENSVMHMPPPIIRPCRRFDAP